MKSKAILKIWLAVSLVSLAVTGMVRADWLEIDKLLASDGAAGDLFGFSVFIGGDYAIVGAPFDDDNGKMNLALSDVSGELLVVSQFTLLGDCRKGRRPSFTAAAEPDVAKKLYNDFIKGVEELNIKVSTGIFQATMEVSLINDGPVTFLLDSKKTF